MAAHSGAQDGLDDTPPSPLTLASRGGVPTPVQLQDIEWGLRSTDSSAAARGTVSPDPVVDVLRDIRTAIDIQQLRRLIHLLYLCTCFDFEEVTYTTTKAWLREITFAQPLPQVTDLANVSAEFSLCYMLPVPHREAVLAPSAKNGWPKEASYKAQLSTLVGMNTHPFG